MNSQILDLQNQPENIDKLAAQRVLYSKAKSVLIIHLFFSIPITILLSITNLILKKYYVIDISLYLSCYGILLTLLDLIVISNLVKKNRQKAATIQELFDTTVFQLKWNDLLVGSKPDFEDIHKYSKKIRKNIKQIEKLKDWYSLKIADLPKQIGIIICQRTNCRYDVDIRIQFRRMFVVVALITFIMLLAFGLINDLKLITFITSVFAPFLPILVFTIRLYKENESAIKNLEKLKDKTINLWTKAIKEPNIDYEDDIRKFQDIIFLNRKDNPMVFDWFYNIKRDNLENEMNYSIEQLIKEIK